MTLCYLWQTTGPIETTTCDYETVESVNDELYHHLNGLVKTPFFKFFRVRTVFSSSMTY
jgi:ERO1-like protein beta